MSINTLLRRPLVSGLIGKSRSTLYRDIQKGLFPKPVSIGGERVAWPANEVQAINQARIASKSDQEIKQLVIALEVLRAEDVNSLAQVLGGVK
jgi:prophage regulatory protein